MKTKRMHAEAVDSPQALARWFDSDEILLPQEVGADSIPVHCRPRQYDARAYLTDDLAEHDYLGDEALHRVVGDLQFGRDLRI